MNISLDGQSETIESMIPTHAIPSNKLFANHSNLHKQFIIERGIHIVGITIIVLHRPFHLDRF